MADEFWADAEQVSHEQLWRQFDAVREHARYRVQMDYFYCSRYYDRAYQGFLQSGVAPQEEVRNLVEQFKSGRPRLNENVIQRIIGVITAKFARQRTLPAVITTMGDWGLQRRGDRMTRHLHGVLQQQKVFDQQRSSDVTDVICGTGALYCGSTDDGQITLEAVPPWQLYCDNYDGRTRDPDTIYRHLLVPRRKIVRRYPDLKDQILRVPNADTRDLFDAGATSESDMVEVVSAWSKPSADGEPDGRAVSACRGLILTPDTTWDRLRLPFAFSRYMLTPDGMWGMGVVQALIGLQDELNRTNESRRTMLQRMSAPFFILEKGAKIVKDHINNAIGHIVEYTGTPPQVVTPGVIHPEQFQHSDRIKSAMFAGSGVSELASASMKPAGLNSGEALRTYSDMMDDAFHDAMLRRDQQILDASELILDEMESLASDGGSYKSKYVGPFGVEEIKYSDIKMDRDAVHLKIVSSSALATTLSGRLQDVKDLVAAGVPMTPAELEQLLNIPDLSERRERQYSMENLLKQVLQDELLERGEWRTPEPRWDLELALDLVSKTILMAQLNACPKDRIALLRRFEQECMTLLMNSTPPQQPQPPTNPAMPDGMPSPVAGGM